MRRQNSEGVFSREPSAGETVLGGVWRCVRSDSPAHTYQECQPRGRVEEGPGLWPSRCTTVPQLPMLSTRQMAAIAAHPRSPRTHP